MLHFNFFQNFPKEFQNLSWAQLIEKLEKPTLFRIQGKNSTKSLIISCLMHGNETSGYKAVVKELNKLKFYPYDIYFLIANIEAAKREGKFIHRDWEKPQGINRIWNKTDHYPLAKELLEFLKKTNPFACIDLHNNNGKNPAYAISRPQKEPLRLASFLTRKILISTKEIGTFSQAIVNFCPALTIECGQVNTDQADQFAETALQKFLNLSPQFPETEEPEIYHESCQVDVKKKINFCFGNSNNPQFDLILRDDVEEFNFKLFKQDDWLGFVNLNEMPLECLDQENNNLTEEFFYLKEGKLLVKKDISLAMALKSVTIAKISNLFFIVKRVQ